MSDANKPATAAGTAPEAAKSEADMLAQWQNMAGGQPPTDPAANTQPGTQVLDQKEIDSLLGGGEAHGEGATGRGVKALLDQSVVNYEKLPMLEVIFDKFERILSTSLRQFTADNVDVAVQNMTSVRFGDYLQSIPMPAGLIVVNVIGLDDYVLMVYESQLIYAVVDVLLGGRKARPVPIAGRHFTNIERRILDNLTEIILKNLGEAFGPVAPVQFKAERMEVNPRFAVISQETNVAILVTLRINLEGREGKLYLCLPYATLEPIREQLLQQFMGEKFGQDNIWENHLSQELYHTTVQLQAVLEEKKYKLTDVLKWRIGDTIELDAREDSPVRMDCGGVTKLVGQMGKALDYKAVKVGYNVTDLNNLKDA